MMEMSELAQKMLDWEKARRELDEVESLIKAAVMSIGKTQTVGNVRATYSPGRKKYDYESVLNEPVSLSIIEAHTTPMVDWRSVCKEVAFDPPFTQGDPYVSLKLLD